MAIDPTAPLTPILPAAPAGTAPDSLTVLQAMARQALANTAAELGQIVGRPGAAQTPRTGAPVEQASRPSTQDTGHTDDASNAARGAPQAQLSSAAKGSPETRMARAVRVAAAEAVPRQTGLAPLMANVRAVVERDDMPAEVREAGGVLLAMTPHAEEITTAQGLRRAVERSGVFLEAHMARTAAAPGAGGGSTPIQGGDMKAALLVFRGALSTWLARATTQDAHDQPAEPVADGEREAESPALVARTSSPPVASSPIGPPAERPAPNAQTAPAPPIDDAPSAIPSSAPAPLPEVEEGTQTAEPSVGLAESEEEPIASRFAAFTAGPKPAQNQTAAARMTLSPLIQAGLLAEGTMTEPAPAAALAEAKAVVARGYAAASADAARSKLPPPPYASGPMAGQKPTPPALSVGQSTTDVVRGLLKGASGALARQDLMQIASLPEPQRHGEAEAVETRPQGARLNLDLPFVTPQGVAVAQFEISHDGGGAGGGAVGPAERTYKARFSIDVEPLGPIHAMITLTGARARVSLWAERAETIARLRAGEESLGAALRQAELSPEIAVHSGAPSSAGDASPLGHFVDQAS